jgi:transposase-like protein
VKKDFTQESEKVIQINEGAIRDHLGALVRSTVEETLNGIVLKRCWAGEVSNVSVLVAIGVNRTDACMGLVESLGEFYPEAKWQRCIVHFYRNVLSVVPTKLMLEIATMLKAIHASEDRSAAIEKAEAVSVKLEGLKLREAARKIRQSIVETFTNYEFPREHRIRIRTNNALERIMREIRRRTRVVGAFPDGHSALMLCAARLRHVAGTQWGAKRYLNLDLLREQDLDKALELAEAM